MHKLNLFLAKRDWQLISFNSYLLMAVFTFGHAVNNSGSIQGALDKGISSGLFAIVWPLYWSAQFQK